VTSMLSCLSLAVFRCVSIHVKSETKANTKDLEHKVKHTVCLFMRLIDVKAVATRTQYLSDNTVELNRDLPALSYCM